MKEEDRHGVLMQGLGRWFVYSRLRAWFGMAVEIPNLLRGVRIPFGATCLDIATGIGWASLGVLRRAASARIVALDYDGTILPRTRAYLKSHGAAANVALCRSDAKHLPFRAGHFDLVTCLYGLHHVRGSLAALGEIARVVKPGGTFALIDPVRKPGTPPRSDHGLEVMTGEQLRRMLDEAGFEILRSRVSLGSLKAVARKNG
jgi:ubiquinone/menaquinone biosynthesis C-methylase UbiE